jgi:isocitrate dehydrogenase
VATIFAWTGALRKRGELDGLDDLVAFASRLEQATLATIEDGEMTGDLAAITTLPNPRKLSTQDFIAAVASRL